MFKKRLATFFLIVGMVISPAALLAAGINEDNTGLKSAANSAGLANLCTGDARTCLVMIIGNVINVVLGTVGIIFIFLILYAGFLWMTAGGEDKQVTKAKDLLKNAAIGLALLIMSFAIASFVIDALAKSVGQTTVPTTTAGS
ncbi:MAG TPA: hypothetical protein VFQ60_04980 [Patescibacteria group bacterium]|nr:hypothetical protein [Patescibacteria group bacterium]